MGIEGLGTAHAKCLNANWINLRDGLGDPFCRSFLVLRIQLPRDIAAIAIRPAGFAAKAAKVLGAGIPSLSIVFAHFPIQAREIPF